MRKWIDLTTRLTEEVKLAPNGRESNLSPEHWSLVRTDEFKQWFGDWENGDTDVSQVVDGNGEPLLVYHGTNAEFGAFDKRKAGAGNDKGLRGRGFYLTPHKATASSYGGNVMECFVNIRSPLIPENYTRQSLSRVLDPESMFEDDDHLQLYKLENDGYFQISSRYVGTVTDMIKDAGFDGVIYHPRKEIVAFEPDQIRQTPKTLVEFFNTKPSIEQSIEGNTHFFEFEASGRKVVVGLLDEGDGEFYMSFTAENDQGMQTAQLLGHNRPMAVLGGVFAVVMQFIEEHQPEMIWFDVDGAETQRVTTYDRILTNLEKQNRLPEGYVWDRDSNDRFYLFVDGYR